MIFTHLPIKLVEFPIEGGDEFDELATIVELHGGDGGGEEGPGLGGRAPQHLSSVGEIQGCQLKRTVEALQARNINQSILKCKGWFFFTGPP